MAADDAIRSVTIRPGFSGGRDPSYRSIIGEGLLGEVRARTNEILGGRRRTFVLVDDALDASMGATVCSSSEGEPASIFSWRATEANKSPEQLVRVLQAMASARLDRSSVVIALGGGLTGDVAGFAAAVYQRGIPWVNCPTTLLSMVDAAIGGKTGVNLETPGSAPLKNFVGAIHHPVLVVSDVTTLRSLPDRQFRAGLAECVKHTMIAVDWGAPELPDWMRANLSAVLQRETPALTELISRNISLKAAVVEADEHEQELGPGGGRMALNLGHTFAHAFETLSGVMVSGLSAPIQHGEAVALGLIAAARCSAALGLVDTPAADDLTSLVTLCGLPVSVKGLPPDDQVIARMMQDKKARTGILRLILPCGRGRVQVVDNAPPAAVRAGLAAIRG
jgi:3-dehydroquinate synthase